MWATGKGGNRSDVFTLVIRWIVDSDLEKWDELQRFVLYQLELDKRARATRKNSFPNLPTAPLLRGQYGSMT